jgi:hypothetical protein
MLSSASGFSSISSCRWVLRGFTQRPSIDFAKTFSLVVKPAAVRTVLSLALSRGWSIHQLDVYSRFAAYLLSLGFVEAKSDTSLFVYRHGSDIIYLLLYVDDIVLTASSSDLP